MPLLAEAYADARLNTKTLDTDIARVEKKLDRAVERFQKKLDGIKFRLDTTQAIARLRELQIASDRVKARIAETVNIGVDVDQAGLVSDAEAAKQIIDSTIGQGVDTGQGIDLPVTVDPAAAEQVGIDAGTDAQRGVNLNPPEIPFDVDKTSVNRSIDDIREDYRKLANTVGRIPLDGDPKQLQIILKKVKAQLDQLSRETATVNIDTDSVDDLLSLELVKKAAKDLDGLTADIQVDVDSAAALGQLGAVDLAKKKVDGDANVNVDVNGTGKGIAKLEAFAAASASATASLSGIDAAKGLASPIAGIASAAAALGPTVPGLIGAGAGFLAIGAGAIAAVGGVAALGVALNKLALADLKEQIAPLKAQLVTAFQPVADVITKDVAPKFIGVFSELIPTVAPLATGLITPIADSLVALAGTFKDILTPELVAPFGQGIASLIDTFGMWIPTLAGVAQQLTGPFFGALNGILNLLFGTAESATPLLGSALSGLGDLATLLIDPFNMITEKVVATFQNIGPAVGNIFGDIGDLLLPFIDGILNLVQLVVGAIDSIGTENLLNLVAAIALVAGLSNPIVGVVGAILFLKDGVDIIGPAITALAPLVGLLGEIATQVFADVTEAVRNIFAAIDFNKVRAVLEPFIRAFQVAFQFVGAVVKAASKIIASYIKGFQESFNIGAFQALFVPFISLFTSLTGSVEKLGNSKGINNFAEKWGGTVASIANALIGLAIRFQQWEIDVITKAIKPVGNALFDLADAFLSAFKTIVNFLAGPIGDGIRLALKPIAILLDAQTFGRTNFAGALDQAGEALDGVNGKIKDFDLGGAREAFNGAADAAVEWGRKTIEQQQALASGQITWEEYLASVGLGKKTEEEVASATEATRTKLDELNASYAAGKIDANEYYKQVGEAASATLPATAKAFEKVQEIASKGIDIGAGVDLAVKQIEAANEAATKGADSTVKELRSTFGSGGIGQFFQISDEEISKVDAGAKKLYEALQKNLGQGKLASFIDAESIDVNRALDDLIRSIQLKAENVARLRQLEALGFPQLAAQLGSLADQPEVLQAILDDLFKRPLDSLGGYEGALGQAFARLQAELGLLGPAVSAGIGENFGEDAAKKVDEGNLTIQQALDKLGDNIRTKAANIRRLNQLEQFGFGVLAEELATLNDDPQALKAALDQLFAGGISAISAANGQIIAAYGDLNSAVQEVGPGLADAIGLDRAAEKVSKDSITFEQALTAAREQTIRQIFALGAIRNLEERGFGAIALKLTEIDDPEQLFAFIQQLSGMSDEALASLNTQIGNDTAALDGYVAEWNAWFQDKFQIAPPEIVDDQKSELQGVGDQVTGAINDLNTQITTTLQTAFGAPLSAGPDIAVDPNALIQGAQNAAGSYAQIFGTSLRDALTRKVNDAFFAYPISFGDGGEAAPKRVIDTFTEIAKQVGEQFALALAGRITESVSTVFTTILPPFALIAGLNTALSLASGIDAGRVLLEPSVRALVDAVLKPLNNAGSGAYVQGLNIGTQFTTGVQIGIVAKTPELILAVLNLALAINSIMKAALEINSPSGVGMFIGDSFVAGIVAGLDRSQPEVEAAAMGLRAAMESATLAPVQLTTATGTQGTGFVPASTTATMTAASATPAGATQTTVLLQQVLTELQSQNAVVREAAVRPLIGEYTVQTTKQPQSPDQLAQDAAFVKAMLG